MSTERIRGNLSTQSRLSGNLYKAGGGSTVSIDPVYNSGVKIADYEIDGEPGEIYIPASTKEIDLLLDTPFSSGQATLTHNISEYDVLIIGYGFTDPNDNATSFMNILTDYFINNCVYTSSPNNRITHILLNPYNTSYNRLIMGDTPNKLYLFDPHNTQIKCVYGLKY